MRETDDQLRARVAAAAGDGSVNAEKIAAASGKALDKLAKTYLLEREEVPEAASNEGPSDTEEGKPEVAEPEPIPADVRAALDRRYVTREEFDALVLKLRHTLY